MRESGCPAIGKVLQELWGIALRRNPTANNARSNSFPESVREPLPVPGNTFTLPQSQHAHPPSQVPLKPVIQELCKSCNGPINPDEKYCGICGLPLGEHEITVPHKKEIPTSAPFGICTLRGSPRIETGKFCGICGASLDSITNPHSQPPLPTIDTSPPRQTPQPAATKVCRSCGNPLSGSELFCGICGIRIKSISPGMSASQQIDGKTCCNCGKPIRATTKFCGTCGMAVGSK
jgi:predicted amidophosphoribosyltransferase